MKKTIFAGAVAFAACLGMSAFGAGPGDEAATAVPLSGNATFNYDSTQYTTGGGLVFGATCFPDNTVFASDAWVCWTATCTGTVTISACGPQQPAGTRLAMWDGCNPPSEVVAPICCDDNGCGQKDARMTCQVVCGHQYLVRIGLDPGTAPLVRQVTFQCDGQGCDGGTTPDCATCCARPPVISGFQSPSLVGTSWEDQDNEKVVHVFDVTNFGSQTPGPYAAPVYENAAWTKGNLGTVFGVTLDDQGNIYVAHTAIYGSDSTGIGGPGAIYKLDSATGAVTVFATLPNVESCTPTQSCAPGLGNLTYSCAHDCIYCSDFEDGRIYRIAMNGTVVEAYNFDAQAIQSPAPISSDPPGPVAYGKLVWGVGVSGDRLYFSVVNEDGWLTSGTKANEIWSIPLTSGTGAFAGAVPTLEVTLPIFSADWSNPVADIAFDGSCCMYLAERSMSGPNFSGAHASRLLKYCAGGAAGTGWTASADLFETGVTGGLQYSDAGGVGIDLATGGDVWTTSDAMKFGPTYYGIIGLPITGGVNAQGLLIDMNGDTAAVDKTFVGSVEVACKIVDRCTAEATATCHIGPDGLPDGTYDLSITVHNGLDGGASANFMLLPDLGTFIPLVPALGPGETRKVTTTIVGQDPGTIMLTIGLFNSQTGTDCCGILDVPVDLPDCGCMLLEQVTVDCHDDRDPTTFFYDVCFTVRNTSSFIAKHFFIIPVTAGVTTTPQYVALPNLLPGQTANVCYTLQFAGAPPVGPDGLWHVSMSYSMHSANLAICCKKVFEVSGPRDCAAPLFGDLNGDGTVDGADLGIMLASWGQTAGPTPSDLNTDGVVNGADIGALLGAWNH